MNNRNKLKAGIKSTVTDLDNMMLRNDMPLPSYTIEKINDDPYQCQVTCSISRLGVNEVIIAETRVKGREEVASNVLKKIDESELLKC